jgi:hypothetical protein
MANCKNLFFEFNQSIKLTDERRQKLRDKRNDLRSRIKGGYSIVKASDRYDHEIKFQTQGSFIMDTIISPEDKDCEYDLDDGLYFIGNKSKEDRPVPATFHNWVIRSINEGKSDNQFEEIVDKQTCVRVKYKGDIGDFNYHIDIPIYYAGNLNDPDLAHLKSGWIESNPIDFIVWFEQLIESGFKREFILERKLYSNQYQNWFSDIRKNDHQLRKIVRYLKAWGDHVDGDMPPGIVMTILGGKNYCPDERDDRSLKDSLIKIQAYLKNNGFKCPRPTSPKDEDLFENYTPEQKTFFSDKLSEFVESAKQAVEISNQKDACRKWKLHLGNRFPCHLAKDEIEGSKTYQTAPLIKSDNSRSA